MTVNKMNSESINMQTSVRFNPTIDCKEVPNKNQLPRDDIWYDSAEYQRIADAIKATIEKMSSTTFVNDDDTELCTRGLERMTKEGSNQTFETKKNVIDAVLDKQIDHWCEGGPKPDDLALTYRQYSTPCVSDAITRGLEDEREAKLNIDEALELCEATILEKPN